MHQQLPVYQIPIAVAMLLLGAVLMGYCIWCLALSFRSRSWPEVDATILAATVEEEYDEGIRYKSCITYRYSVSGRDLTSSRFRIGSQILSGSPRRAKKQISAYPPGKKVRVRYRPNDPSFSVLEPGPHFALFAAPVLISVIVISAWNWLTGAVILK